MGGHLDAKIRPNIRIAEDTVTFVGFETLLKAVCGHGWFSQDYFLEDTLVAFSPSEMTVDVNIKLMKPKSYKTTQCLGLSGYMIYQDVDFFHVVT